MLSTSSPVSLNAFQMTKVEAGAISAWRTRLIRNEIARERAAFLWLKSSRL